MALEISSQYLLTSKAPFDSKMLVNTYADLVTLKYAYNGMLVGVGMDSDETRNGVYYLHDASCNTVLDVADVTDYANWHKVATVAELFTQTNAIVTRVEALENADVVTTDDVNSAVTEQITALKAEIAASNYVTVEELASFGYVTQSTLNNYALRENIPTVPTKLSEFENDTQFVTADQIPETDLSNYYTKEEVDGVVADVKVPTKVSELENDAHFLTTVPDEYVTYEDLNGFYTKAQADEAISKAIAEAELAEGEVDLSSYYTKTETDAAIQTAVEGIEIPEVNLEGYATETFVTEKIETAIEAIPPVDFTGYATEEFVTDKIAAIPPTDFTGIATEKFVTDAIAAIPETDLSGYATETFVTDAIAALPDTSDMATKTWVNEQNFVTDISGKADVEHTHEEYLTADALTGYSKFSGSYNDLTDKPEIPSTEGLASETYVQEYVATNAPKTDLTGYATEEFVTTKIAEVDVPDVSNFITMADVEDKNYLVADDVAGKVDTATYEADKATFALKTELPTVPTKVGELENDAGYITAAQVPETDLTGYATEQFVTDKIAAMPSTDLSDYATKTFVTETVETAVANIPETDLTDYATKKYVDDAVAAVEHPTVEIPTNVSEFTNDAGYITAAAIPTKVSTFENDAKYVVEDALTAAVATKANEVPFTTNQVVGTAVGGFVVGDSLMNMTVAQILVKLLGLTEETVKEEITIDYIVENELATFVGTEGTGDSANEFTEIDPDTVERTASGYYVTDNSLVYQVQFGGNDQLDAQTFTIPEGTRVARAYKFDDGITQAWQPEEFPGMTWVEAGTVTRKVNGKEYNYILYKYNVDEMGDAITVAESWRFEIEVIG